MSQHVRTRLPFERAPAFNAFDHLGRTIPCSKCGVMVCVFEAPTRYLDPENYVGGCCLRVVEATPTEPVDGIGEETAGASGRAPARFLSDSSLGSVGVA